MSSLVARLLLSMLLLPLSAALVILTFLILTPNSGPSVPMVLVTWGFVYAFIAIYWILLWRDVVRWTAGRALLTLLSAVAALAAGGLVSVFLEYTFGFGNNGPDWVGILMLTGGGVPLVWLFLTVLVWRENAGERRERVATLGVDTLSCPVCGYNLTGLRELRCPECGAEFTLEGVLAGQPHKEDALTH